MNQISKKYLCTSNKNPKKNERSHSRITPEKQSQDDSVSLNVSINQITAIHDKDPTKKPEPNQPLSKLSQKIETFLDSKAIVSLMSFITIYSLFADDIKTLTVPKSTDSIFSSLVVICLILFSFELILSFQFKPTYKWSFYFWLDLTATLSLITDIEWIWDALIGVSSNNSSSKQLQNAGQTSRAGTRTSRVLRIVRLVRLIRLVKLYKSAKIALRSEEEHDLDSDLDINDLKTESKVGKKLSELTMKRVILIVLMMLFILPLFDSSFYYTAETSWDFGAQELSSELNMEDFDAYLQIYISYHLNDIRPLIYLTWKNESGSYEWAHGINYNDLRYDEIFYSSFPDVIAIFDLRYDTKLTSLLSIFKTLFICIVLTLGALYFTRDSEKLVIKPIEKIIEMVKRIAKNPLLAAEIGTMEEQLDKAEKKWFCFRSKIEMQKADYETKIIENTFIKIGVLLALGFGEAGSSIIGSNVGKNTEMDAILTGSKVVGIFGFCDIRNFTDTTEELQEGVMMFVNEIAQIIHGLVDKYFGAANKNIGDAFLLVWKFKQSEFFLSDGLIFRNPDSKRAFYIPDLALLSFLKIQCKINKDPSMFKYRSHPKLIQRMPGYEVKMGFGLHLGWAIEGAIGTYFKLDASYLSPHVNLASALESLTKLYGVPLLLSEALFEVLSGRAKRFCRKIDFVQIKESFSPLALYTSDSEFFCFSTGKMVGRKKEFYRKKGRILKKKLEKGEISSGELFERSKEVEMMRKGIEFGFLSGFDEGFELYVKGEWLQAREKLSECLRIRPTDGPTQAILQYMSEFKYTCPEFWHFRNFNI